LPTVEPTDFATPVTAGPTGAGSFDVTVVTVRITGPSGEDGGFPA
jgi:hypothetical protein